MFVPVYCNALDRSPTIFLLQYDEPLWCWLQVLNGVAVPKELARNRFGRDSFLQIRMLNQRSEAGPLQPLRKRVHTNSKFPNSVVSLFEIIVMFREQSRFVQKEIKCNVSQPSWVAPHKQGEGAVFADCGRKKISKSKAVQATQVVSGCGTIHGRKIIMAFKQT